MPRPVGVTCFICGREFGKASIAIHTPQCEKKWDMEQLKLPKKQRRPCPSKPEEYERIISGELKGKDYQTAMDQYNLQAFEDFNKKALLECKNCGRTFLAKPLEIHSRSCKPGSERPAKKPRSPTKMPGINPNGSRKSSTAVVNNRTSPTNASPVTSVTPTTTRTSPVNITEKSSNGLEKSSNGYEKSNNGSEKSSNGSEKSSNGSEKSSNGSSPNGSMNRKHSNLVVNSRTSPTNVSAAARTSPVISVTPTTTRSSPVNFTEKGSNGSIQNINESMSPERNNNIDRYQVRPGTYKKSGTTPCDEVEDEDDPTREAIIAMVEKDVAFSDVDNRRLLMGFIKKVCQAEKFL